MTAVEWLVNELFDDNQIFGVPKDLLNKAKEMEKQQIIDAFNSGQEAEAKHEFWTKGNYYFDKQFKNK